MDDCMICKPKDHETLRCLSKMNNCSNYKVYPRVYVQFNDLVFDGIEKVETASLAGDFKTSYTSYPFKNGSFYGGAFKHSKLLMNEQELSLDLKLPLVQLTRLQALDYASYIQYQLSHEGKLWAFDTGGKLIWAFAVPKHPAYSDYSVMNGKILSYSLDFTLPEGIWHHADTESVFLQPYDMCDFKDMMGIGKAHECNAIGECIKEECDLCCECDDTMRYCNTCWDPYNPCDNPYRIVYNCGKAQALRGKNPAGYQFMSNKNIIAGNLISDGVTSSPVTLTLVGEFTNPIVKIGNSGVSLKGKYKGSLTFYEDGKVAYSEGDMCETFDPCNDSFLPLDKIEYLCNRIGLYAEYGDNLFTVYSETNPPTFNFAYLKLDELYY